MDKREGETYARAGVDLKKVKGLHELYCGFLEQTFRMRKGKFGEVAYRIGHYAGLVDIGEGRLLALHADGVGTKVLIAQMLRKFDTIGIDCVAMCANDLVCVGAEPVAMLDYLVLEKPDKGIVSEIVKGLVKGAEEAGVAIIGGETAIMPDVVKGFGGLGFDLAGMMVGVVNKSGLVTGERIIEGDVVLGVLSTGIHSNGLTLARKVLLGRYRIDEYISELGRTVGEELLEPTAIYVKPVLKVLEECEVHGVAHITGGAFTKLLRLTKGKGLGFRLEDMPEPQPIFKLIQKEGKISTDEMYKTFNMGVGLCLILPETEVDKASSFFEKMKHEVRKIGRVVKGEEIQLPKFSLIL